MVDRDRRRKKKKRRAKVSLRPKEARWKRVRAKLLTVPSRWGSRHERKRSQIVVAHSRDYGWIDA